MKNDKKSTKKVTGTDIARAVGCSQASVSKVINNHQDISIFLREKILEQARKMNYHIHGRNELHQVAVILPAPWRFRLDGYVASLLNAMIYVLHRRNIRFEIVPEDNLNLLLSHGFDGGISISWEPGLTADWFERFELPLVRINTNPELSGKRNMLAYVNMDGEKSMRILLDKLYSLDHRRIVLLAPDPQEIEERRARYQGFYNYLKSKHVQHPESRCIFGMRTRSFEENLASLKQAVSAGTTALIAVDEGEVRNALALIGTLKLNIPGRISIVSWEQKDVLPFYNPPITGMAMDYTQLSEAAVDLLASLNRKEEVSDIYFPFKLIERESVSYAYRKKYRGKLPQRILQILENGPESRAKIATVLGVNPYSGHFNQSLLLLLNTNQISYSDKPRNGRARLLQLNNTENTTI